MMLRNVGHNVRRTRAVREPHPQIRVAALGLLPAAAVFVLLAGGNAPVQALIDEPPGSLTAECQAADVIALLRVEKVNREKKAIVYRKVRDLKGTFPQAGFEFFGDTFTHVLGPIHNPERHSQDVESQDLQTDAILAWAAEGKTAVIFQRGQNLATGQNHAICVGHAWYTAGRRGRPPAKEPWVLRSSVDSRLQRLFCGEADELVAAVTNILAGKEATVPRMRGTVEILTDRAGPIRRLGAEFDDAGGRKNIRVEVKEFHDPFLGQAPWSTHRGNPQRTGADGGPGPKAPKVLWVYKSEDHFIAPFVPGARDLYASSLGAFNSPRFEALALDAAGDKQVRWAKGAPLLRQPSAGAPALLGGAAELLAFGDGFHTGEEASLRCLRAADGFPLWQLPVAGKLVHFEGTPTCADRKLYVGGGNAGVLCIDPNRVTLEGKEQDLAVAQAALEQRWKELLAQYEVEKKKDPQFALPPDEALRPRPTPKRLWQQGQDQWHVDAPVAVVEDRVLAASAYLDDEKAGERALVCLRAGDGAVVWKAPLALNPWAGPTVGPYVLVGCSSIRLDAEAVPGARGEVVALDLDTGAVQWRKQVPGGVLSSVAVKAGLAVFTATDGKVRAWDAFTGRERWCYDAKAPFFAGPAVARDTVYVADLEGVVHALNLADGKEEWALALGTDPATKACGMVYGSPIVHRGRLYLATCSLGGRAAPTRNVVVCIGDK
jgi:outer membrane protein assembly factor BamB